MLGYFALGPYVNVTLFMNPVLPSVVIPLAGILLMLAMLFRPAWFEFTSVTFFAYAVALLFLTA